eukprot:CAMPEP_0168339796 /NCGR_PEP_ID=MMETSP0213-20121227/13677_1 /TAXON_ID=151035 /ORGANISM="Euplotes harpa, Strain FSP1.4" /LENGTH=75 /DNA_ID=CAMNT_0008345901 /DNA_START=462 /DNA_END=689 /DNA_ORIENTATION=+
MNNSEQPDQKHKQYDLGVDKRPDDNVEQQPWRITKRDCKDQDHPELSRHQVLIGRIIQLVLVLSGEVFSPDVLPL